MELFIIIIAIGFIQVWGTNNPIHKDDWLDSWAKKVETRQSLTADQQFILSVCGPLIVIGIALAFIDGLSSWLMLPVGVLVLLYSFGRGEFNGIIDSYTLASDQENWQEASLRARKLGVNIVDIEEANWQELHARVLREAGYRGFERMFAVLFWFFLLGPVGAVFYRIVFLYCARPEVHSPLALRVLWFFEWPAVRILGLSFALTGNFVGCINHFQESVFCAHRGTRDVLSPMILGALSVDDGVVQTTQVTRDELVLLEKLYTRTLWFWMAAVSIAILMT